MNLWLAEIPAVPRLPYRNVGHELAPAADGAALVMVGLVFFLLGCITVGALVLHRRALRHQDSPQDDEQRQKNFPKPDSSSGRDGGVDEEREAWERPPNWWKEGY